MQLTLSDCLPFLSDIVLRCEVGNASKEILFAAALYNIANATIQLPYPTLPCLSSPCADLSLTPVMFQMSTMRNFHLIQLQLQRTVRLLRISQGLLERGHEDVTLYATQTRADCFRVIDLLQSARRSLKTSVVDPLHLVQDLLLADATNAYRQIQNSASGAINLVSHYESNGSSNRREMLASLAQYNDTIWTVYSQLTLTLKNLAGTFWDSLNKAVGSLNSVSPLRLRQERILPLLGLIGDRCRWCLTAADQTFKSIVQSRMNSYIRTTLKIQIVNAKLALDTVYNDYLTDTWIANISADVSFNDSRRYSRLLDQVGSYLTVAQNQLTLAGNDVTDALDLVDDLVKFIWHQKCRIELPKLVKELDSNQMANAKLISSMHDYLAARWTDIETARRRYVARNTSLLDVASSIPFDDITSFVTNKNIRLDTNLNDRILQVEQVSEEIHSINYLFMSIVSDDYLESESAYWNRFNISNPSIVYPTTTQTVNDVVMATEDYKMLANAKAESAWTAITNITQV